MKLLCICDGYINRECLPELRKLETLACDVVYYDNPLLSSLEKTMECMSQTEQKGAEGYPVPQELFKLVKDVDIIVVHMTPIPRELIIAAENLKFIAVMRGGCDNLDIESLDEKNVKIVNAAWRSSNSVADATVGMILAETRNIARSYAALKNNNSWRKVYPNSGNIHDLATRTIGIIGFGHIGQRVAQRLKGFEANIIVHDPYISDETIIGQGYQPVTKEKLCREADIITIHLRQSSLTEKFIGKEELNMMKPTATLVNTARARLVDENALVQALEEGGIQGAALDVFYDEPLPDDHPFLKLDNVTFTSHVAGASDDTRINSLTIIFSELKRFLNGEEPISVVRSEKWQVLGKYKKSM